MQKQWSVNAISGEELVLYALSWMVTWIGGTGCAYKESDD